MKSIAYIRDVRRGLDGVAGTRYPARQVGQMLLHWATVVAALGPARAYLRVFIPQVEDCDSSSSFKTTQYLPRVVLFSVTSDASSFFLGNLSINDGRCPAIIVQRMRAPADGGE